MLPVRVLVSTVDVFPTKTVKSLQPLATQLLLPAEDHYLLSPMRPLLNAGPLSLPPQSTVDPRLLVPTAMDSTLSMLGMSTIKLPLPTPQKLAVSKMDDHRPPKEESSRSTSESRPWSLKSLPSRLGRSLIELTSTATLESTRVSGNTLPAA